ncbi:MAG: Cd(II)/Pb(II)-responsive transcriptional regulator [Pseudomonadota bacterium]
MKIGDLAQATGTQAQTIRYYEREGLLAEPARTDSNYRRYDQTHVARLSFIRHCRSLDMTLEEIRALLRFKDDPAANCVAVNELLDEHICHVADRIRELKRLQAELKDLHAQCDAHGASCGILGALDKKGKSVAKSAGKAHIAGSHGHH